MDKVSKEVKIGISFIVAIFLLYFGISFLKGINIFKPANSYIAVFDDVSGLTRSTPVTMKGFSVGLVHSIELNEDNPNQVLVELNMDKGVKIPKGSKLNLDVSMMGTATLIVESNPYTGEYLSPTDTIYGKKKSSILDSAGDMLPEVQKLLPKIDSILSGIETLVNNPALNESLTNVNQVTKNLVTSTQQLNTMMVSLNKNVPAITNNLASVSEDLSATSKQFKEMDLKSTYQSVDSTMKNIQFLSTRLTSKDNSIGLLFNDRQLYDSINTTISNASGLLKDVKENPQRYINVKVF